MRKPSISRTPLLVLAVLLLSACSTTKFVPDGEHLLSSVRLKTDGHYRDINVAQLRNHVRQQPNSRWFSFANLPLATYSLSGRDSSRWVNRMLRSMGEAPVLYDSVMALQTCTDLCRALQNEGWLRAHVTLATRTKGKKLHAVYTLHPGSPYYVRRISYQIADERIARLLLAQNDSLHRLLYEGMKFDASLLDAERQRLTNVLADHGYYRFHKEYISYVADTVRNSRMVDLTLRLALYRQSNHPDTLHTCYTIGRIAYSNGDAADKRLHLRRSVLEECTHLAEGHPYSAAQLQRTYNHFGRLQAVKYTSITLTPAPEPDKLDCDIVLQASKTSTVSFQPEGTNTAGDLGAAASLTYENRNLFRGSEVFSIQLRGAYEAIKGLEGYSTQEDFAEYSVETKLTFPRFLIPFFGRDQQHSMDATSEVSLMYDMQNRPEFHRRVLSAALRYKWSFPRHRARYQIDLLDLDYVFMPWISETFHREYLESENSRNAILRYNYEDLFVTKIGFGFSYSNDNFAVKVGGETSGNLLSVLSRATGTEKDADGHYRLFNIAYAQYAKADVDVTRSFLIDRNNRIVLHAAVGIAYPYGNSNILPFEKRYFSGGANSVRGWSVRSLGPGSYKERDGRINFINQTGDMKLDLNAEYRTHLFWKLGAALFVDAGNIWTLRDYADQPGGKFRLRDFPSQIAVGYGLGVRFNFDYFILRFDLGMKAVNPAYSEEDEEHYPLLHPRFSRDYAFHFAVGLPF
jgi:outer membrane protein assembly factor BamA